MLGLMTHTLRVGNGKSCGSGQIPRLADVVRSAAATMTVKEIGRQSRVMQDTTQKNPP